MNILYVLHTDGLAGANRSMLQLMEGLRRSDESFRIYVIVPKQHDKIAPLLDKMGCTVIPEDFTNCTTVMHGVREAVRYLIKSRGYRRILEDVKGLGIDIVHTNTSVCDLGAYLASKMGVPHIWHVRENMNYYSMSLIRPFRYRSYFESPDNLAVCISNYIEGYIKSRYKKARTTVVYNAIEGSGKERAQKDNTDIEMILSGIIVKNKGPEDAIKALNIVVNDKGRKNVHLNIVGTHPSTAVYENELKRLVAGFGLEKNVRFMPFTDDIDRIRQGCDIALQCSVMEGLGRVTIEAMLDGLLVIGARSGATTELIREGFNGWFYEPGDHMGLADRIMDVIVLDKKEADLVRHNARIWASDKFSTDVITGKMIAIYRETVNKKADKRREETTV